MKTTITLLGLLIGTFAFGQNCNCVTDTLLKTIISCDTIRFDNSAKLIWSFNCDSSWLTFVSPMSNKTVIFSLGRDLMNLTGRLGHIYLLEYQNTFLVQNNVISGCCSPPDYYLYDKHTGKLKANLGRLVFYSEDRNLPFVVSVTNSDYTTTSASSYNSLCIYNIDKDRKYIIELPRGQVVKALENTKQMYPEYLFDKPVINGTLIKLTYFLKTPKDKSDKPVKTVLIDLKKYSS